MVSQKDHRYESLPSNTPYSLCHLIGLTTINDQAHRKIKEQKFLYQREGSMAFEGLSSEEEAVLIIALEKSSTVMIAYYGS